MSCNNFKKCMNGLIRIGEEEGEYMLTTLKTIVSNEIVHKIFEKMQAYDKTFARIMN